MVLHTFPWQSQSVEGGTLIAYHVVETRYFLLCAFVATLNRTLTLWDCHGTPCSTTVFHPLSAARVVFAND